MTTHQQYTPGRANLARVHKDGDTWTLVRSGDLRWELEDFGGGTRLTLWHHIDRRYIAMGAAGWHICFDVLDHALSGTPLGRIVGPRAMQFEGWQRLSGDYAEQFSARTRQCQTLVATTRQEGPKAINHPGPDLSRF